MVSELLIQCAVLSNHTAAFCTATHFLVTVQSLPLASKIPHSPVSSYFFLPSRGLFPLVHFADFSSSLLPVSAGVPKAHTLGELSFVSIFPPF